MSRLPCFGTGARDFVPGRAARTTGPSGWGGGRLPPALTVRTARRADSSGAGVPPAHSRIVRLPAQACCSATAVDTGSGFGTGFTTFAARRGGTTLRLLDSVTHVTSSCLRQLFDGGTVFLRVPHQHWQVQRVYALFAPLQRARVLCLLRLLLSGPRSCFFLGLVATLHSVTAAAALPAFYTKRNVCVCVCIFNK